MRKLTILVLVLIQMTITLFQAEAEKQSPPLTALSSSEEVFSQAIFIKDVAVRFSNDNKFFYILTANHQVTVYDSQHKLLNIIPSQTESPDSIAVDTEGRIFIADSTMNRIKVLSPKGKVIRTISADQPHSIAVFSNGSVVIASASNSSLLHIYDSSGRKTRDFGSIKQFAQDNESQNKFLNRGKVLVDSSDTIYYIHKFAPVPLVQRFSKKGELLSEFVITGSAIDLQVDVAQEFLRNRHPNKVGGVNIINSASIDPETNHLWIGLNGSSDSGVVYQYRPDGKKVQEYSFIVNSRAQSSNVITGVNHVIVRAPSIYIFTFQGAFTFDLNRNAAITRAQLQSATCPVAVPFDNCKTPCGTDNTADDKDCKTELLASINMGGMRIIDTTCNQDNERCLAQIKVCKESNGVQTSHNIELSCANSGGGGEGGGGDVTPPLLDPPSPILIDVQGNGFDLTDAHNGVVFDINGDGTAERLSWTATEADDSWLALDRNGNGTVDNGTELFGNFTPQPSAANPNGFIALAEYDKTANGGNGDGRINSSDLIFSSLRLWRDANHNGMSEAGELFTLPTLGLTALDLEYKEKKKEDEHGNWFRYRAKVYDAHGAQLGRWAWDVFLTSVNQ